MKHVFIFIGDPATGKTVLGNLIMKNENTIVIDELPNIKKLGPCGLERRFSLQFYDYVVYITNITENIELIKAHYPDTPVSVCEFRR